jgi:hypothetical protein
MADVSDQSEAPSASMIDAPLSKFEDTVLTIDAISPVLDPDHGPL